MFVCLICFFISIRQLQRVLSLIDQTNINGRPPEKGFVIFAQFVNRCYAVNGSVDSKKGLSPNWVLLVPYLLEQINIH